MPLQPAGVQVRRLSGAEFHDWLLGFFQPRARSLFWRRPEGLLRETRCDDETSALRGPVFAETLFYDHPRSDQDNQCWWFGPSALRCLSIDGLRRRPAVGQVTGETRRGMRTTP